MSTVSIVETVKTADGRNVALLSDGSWRYEARTPQPDTDRKEVAVTERAEQPPATRHFRQTTWGMCDREVGNTEAGEPTHVAEDLVVYDGSVGGLSCDVVYIFAANKLVRAKYLVTARHADDNKYLDDYSQLKDSLKKKYGTPAYLDGQQSDSLWTNDLYRDDAFQWGMAVSAGHLSYFCEWQTPETTIFLVLDGDNYECRLVVEYVSKEMRPLEEALRDSRRMDEL